MRLKQIKLAGFKSFVDPTKIPFPNALTAILGPNGCGKSNVIDAVRWVLGESSAKNLRGDAMTDVIFNGSNARKPVSQASVELVFENTDERVSSQYANYNEISVKRMVNREAQSFYFLNGNKCRRKDITDLFMGTGLGPRSYAIIEQGMISRLIESKPQDLRVFIEEAAGVSRYKERRRDSENRIRHTRENLERLSDIRLELGTQLDKLKRQANAAIRFRELKAQERSETHQLHALRWSEQSLMQSEIEAQLQQQLIQVESYNQKLTAMLAGNVDAEQQGHQLRDSEQQLQQQIFTLASKINELEQHGKHQKQLQERLKNELSRIEQQQLSHEQNNLNQQQQYELLAEEIDMLEPELEMLEAQLEMQAETYEVEKEQFSLEQESFVGQKQQLESLRKQVLQWQTQKAQGEAQLNRWQDTVSRLAADNPNNQQQQYADAADVAALEAHIEALYGERNQLQQSKQQSGERQQQLQIQLREALKQLSSQEGQLTAVEKQMAALQSYDGPQVFQFLEYDKQWRKAIEVALGPLLEAPVNQTGGEGFSQGYDSDFSQLMSEVNLKPWLQHTHFVETAEMAQQKLPHLSDHERVITQDGQQFFKGGHLAQPLAAQSLLELTENQQQLQQQVHLSEALVEQLQAQLEALESEFTQINSELEPLKNKLNEQQQQLKQVLWQNQQLEQQKQANAAKTEKWQQDFEQAQLQLATADEALLPIEEALEEALEQLQSLEDAISAKEALFSQAQAKLQQLQDAKQDYQQRFVQMQAKLTQSKQSLALLKTAREQQSEQSNILQEQAYELQMQLEQALEHQPQQQPETQDLLEQKIELEQQLTSVREQISELEASRRQAALDEQELRNKQQQLLQSISDLKVKREGIKTQADNFLLELKDANLNVEQVLQQAQGKNVNQLASSIEQVKQKIARLGAINLAAVEEYEQQSERKRYLDEQDADLNKALEALEQAIAKIDRETRAKFKETFEMVNAGFQELFPKVFGGGRAYLDLTEQDLLTTGVTIMAQPPGKRNATIHLLSGGEKALTALSLVFAIFRLNPAPFCMLDEVDAPLDDANVGRFCRLVKEMSSTVQFIYISHNKVSMEMAEQLTGVTMHEPGVSRIVAVDMEQALAFVDAV
ncbi:AAA family ATPase [Paraferrimonas sp. SM1919]|uniref:AAA family ATPase n=1 Tax=Paraferrimonas sp. SM1919 TaxID=2662263 RepID=UPI0013D01B4B|nr:AAA family ATPase [Paraferrimonas sp. SM1919]